jgi:hypothetical protein
MQNLYDSIVRKTNTVAENAFGIVGVNRRKPFKWDFHIKNMNRDLIKLETILHQDNKEIVNCQEMIDGVDHCVPGDLSHKDNPKGVKRRVTKALKGIKKCIAAREKKLKQNKIKKNMGKIRENYGEDPKKFYQKMKRPGSNTPTDIEIKATTVEHHDDYHTTLKPLPKHLREHTKPKPEEEVTATLHTTHNLEETQETFTTFWTKTFEKRILEFWVDGENPLPFMEGKMETPKHQFEAQWDQALYEKLYDNIKCLKAAGTNAIPGELFTQAPVEIKKTWSTLLRNMWETNWVPRQWRESWLILLAKNKMTEFMNNYRPISLAQTEQKLYTNIIQEKMAKFCEQNKILEDLQFGSRKGRSVAQALMTFRAVIDDAHNHDKDLFVMYLDFAKAYDSVEHVMLERTMTYYNIPQDIIDKVMNIYKDNEATLFTPHGRCKRKVPMNNGVKQGDSLSPLLFILFINPLLTKLRESGCGYKFHMDETIHIPNVTYSDDNTLITSTQKDMERLAQIVMEFCSYTGIELNPSKCIYTYKTKQIVRPIKINNCNIKAVNWNEAQRLLGLKSELSQNYETQIKECKQTLQQDINYITNKNIYIKERIKVINILFIPKILYKMNVVKFDQKNLNLMNNILKKEAKKAIRCPNNYMNERFWKEKEDGGMGLLNLETVNDKTMLSTFINQGMNHTAVFPKACIEHQIKEKGLTIGTLKEMKTSGDKSYLSGIAQILKKMPFEIIHKQSREKSNINICLNEGRYYTMYDKSKKA